MRSDLGGWTPPQRGNERDRSLFTWRARVLARVQKMLMCSVGRSPAFAHPRRAYFL